MFNREEKDRVALLQGTLDLLILQVVFTARSTARALLSPFS